MYEDTPAPIPPGTVLADKFRVVRRLGFGGMGSVYEVEHELTKHRRALKLMHPDFAARPEHVARFIREASAAGRIGNPHIAETFDAGKLDSGEPYIVMELLEGQPLSDRIEQNGPLGFAEAIDLVRQAAEGIEAAHSAGIVHRDLKPDNIFVCSGPAPFVKILDFGISKFDPEKTGDMRLTVDGTAMGTPTHMSPEQIRGQSDIDERTDVYALGLVLYESVTGTKAYSAETLTQLAVLIHEGQYAPISQIRPDVPGGLEAVVARALDADRNTRYSSVRVFIGALDGLSGRPSTGPLGTAQLPVPHIATARSEPAPEPAIVGGAATDAGVEKVGATAPAKRSAALAVFAALLLMALAALGLTRLWTSPEQPPMASGSDSSAVAPDQASAAEVVSQSVVPTAPPAPVRTAPAASANAGAVSATPPTGPARPLQTIAPAASLAPPTPAKRKEPRTRAGNVGLVEENPF